MAAAMDAVGVDAAVLISPFALYRYDASYALEVRAAHPGRFALIKPVDPTDPAVAETVAEWAALEGTVGVRIMLNPGPGLDPEHPGIDRVLAAAARASLPVNLMCWGLLEHFARYARAHPNSMLVLDHLGLEQPFHPPAPPAPFADLPGLLALAEYDNVAVKITARARSPTNPIPTTISGTRSAGSSTRSVSTAACGAPTGHARSICSPTSRA